MKTHIAMVVTVGGLSWMLNTGHWSALAMDRLTALSMIESGDNDQAIGQAGEVSRFQIRPLLWVRYCGPYPVTASTNPQAALRATRAIMDARCRNFEYRFHRSPTDFEYYVLWNAPAQIRKPGKAVSERANRFCNLTTH